MKGLRVAVLSALDDEDHQERHDGGAGVDDQLPSVGPAKEWTGRGPHGDDQKRQREGDGSADLMLRPPRRLVEARGWGRSVIPGVAVGGVAVGIPDAVWRRPARAAWGAQSALDPTGQEKNN